jgi:hypothetical protein
MHARRRLLAPLVALALAACAAPSSPRIAIDPKAVPTLVSAPFGDLVEQWIDAPGTLYVRRPRPDLGAFHAMRFERAAIFYDPSVTPPLVADHTFLMRALDNAVRNQVGASIPLPVAKEPGAGVLRVSSEVVGLEFDRGRATNSRVTSIIQPGRSATFVLQLSDDASGAPLVRLAARRQLPGGIFTGPWAPDLDRAAQLFQAFGRDARESLSHVVRPPAPPE